MANSTAGISLGDAVLTVVVDLTSADGALARFGSELPAKLKPSGDAANAVAKNLDTVTASATAAADALAKTATAATAVAATGTSAGKTLADAFTLVKPQVQQSNVALQNMAFALRNVEVGGKVAGEAVAEGGHKATEALQKGVATAGLFSEATGVTLPRHVRTFIAELPVLGAALEAAFDVAAIGFVIEAIIATGEKIDEFLDKPRKLEEAWSKVGDAQTTASRSLQQSIDQSGASIVGLTEGPVAKLDFELKHMSSDAEKVASDIGKIGDAFVAALKLEDTSKFNLLSFFLPNSREVSEQASHFVGDLQSTLLKLGNQAGLVSLKAQLQGVDAELKETGEKALENAKDIGTALDLIEGRKAEATADVFKDRLKSLNDYKESLKGLEVIVQQGIEADAAAKQSKAAEERAAQGQALREEAKRDLDAELANIELRKSSEHLAFASGIKDAADWAVAQLNADQAVTAVRERNLQRLLDIEQQFGSAESVRAAKQVLEIAQTKDAADSTEALAAATQKYHDATLKILKDWQDLESSAVAKNFDEAQKAAQRLTLEELKLADAQKKLQDVQVKSDFSAQENAITQLANFGIITEQQKAERLRVLYQQEENQALQSLRDLLAKEKTAVDAAQTKLDLGRNNPVLTEAQLADLQINLDRLKILYANTQTEISGTTATYEQKRIALQRGNVAEAIALAQSEGKAVLAAHLEESQATLDAARAQLALARARGIDTKAAEEEVRSLQKVTNALIKEASQGKDNQKVMTEWAKVGQDAFRNFESSIAEATAAVVSGQESMGKAIEAAILGVIGKLAQEWADYYIALAIAAAASGDWGQAAGYAAAAAALELVVGATSGLASSINSSAQNSSATGSGSAASDPGSPAQTPQQQPVQTTNIQHLAGGGLFSKQMVAVVGDAREAVVPLGNDSSAIDEIAGRLHERMGGSGGETHNHYYNIKGSLIDHNKLMREQSRAAKKGKGRMTVNNSFRVTRRG